MDTSNQPSQKSKIPFIILIFILLTIIGAFGAYSIFNKNKSIFIQSKAQITQTPPTLMPSPTPIPLIDWKTYIDNTYNFQFKYPSEWHYKESTTADLRQNGVPDFFNKYYAVYFDIKNTFDSSGLPLFFSISIFNNQENWTVDHWVEQRKSQLGAGFVSQEMTQIAGNKAIKANIRPGFETIFGTYISSDKKTNIVYEIYLGGNGRGGSDYPDNDAFVKEEKNNFQTLLSTFKFVNTQIDITKNKRIYTNNNLGFSLEYPVDWYTEEYFNSLEIYNQNPQIHEFTRDRIIAKSQYYNIVDYPTDDFIFDMTFGISLANDDPTSEIPLAQKSEVTIAGIKTVSGILTGGEGEKILFARLKKDKKVFEFYGRAADSKYRDYFYQILSSFALTDQTVWKIYQDKTITIAYPNSWIYDPSLKGLHTTNGSEGFIIISPDYKNSPAGFPESGGIITLYVGKTPFSETLGLVSQQDTTWLGEKATLKVYQYEGDNLVLTATSSKTKYQLVMSGSSDQFIENNKDIFLLIANSLEDTPSSR